MKTLITFLFFLITIQLFSQEGNSNRFELDLHKEFTQCGNIAFGSDGIFFYCKNVKSSRTDFRWQLLVLDTNLNVIKEGVLLVDKYGILKKVTNDSTFTYFIFLKGSNELLTYRVHHKTLEIDFIQLETGKGINRLETVSFDNQLFLFVKTNSLSQLISCNFSTKEVISSNLNFGNLESKLKGLKVDSLNKSLLVTIEREHDYNKYPAIYFYDFKLKLLQLFDPNNFIDNHVQSIQAKAIGLGEYIYSGTYSKADDDFIEGIYCLGVKANSELFLEKFIPLNEISAFKRYLNESGEETKELRKAKKNLITGVHEVIVTDDHLYMIAEFYGPTYNTGVGSTTLFGGDGISLTYKFDGFLYKGAALIALDNNHDIESDIFLNLKPYPKPFTESLLVDAIIENKTIEVIYPFEEQIISVRLDLSGDKLSQKSYQLTEEEVDKKQVHWYGNVYLDYGYFDKYIVFNEESITDKVTVKHNGYFIEKQSRNFK